MARNNRGRGQAARGGRGQGARGGRGRAAGVVPVAGGGQQQQQQQPQQQQGGGQQQQQQQQDIQNMNNALQVDHNYQMQQQQETSSLYEKGLRLLAALIAKVNVQVSEFVMLLSKKWWKIIEACIEAALSIAADHTLTLHTLIKRVMKELKVLKFDRNVNYVGPVVCGLFGIFRGLRKNNKYETEELLKEAVSETLFIEATFNYKTTTLDMEDFNVLLRKNAELQPVYYQINILLLSLLRVHSYGFASTAELASTSLNFAACAHAMSEHASHIRTSTFVIIQLLECRPINDSLIQKVYAQNNKDLNLPKEAQANQSPNVGIVLQHMEEWIPVLFPLETKSPAIKESAALVKEVEAAKASIAPKAAAAAAKPAVTLAEIARTRQINARADAEYGNLQTRGLRRRIVQYLNEHGPDATLDDETRAILTHERALSAATTAARVASNSRTANTSTHRGRGRGRGGRGGRGFHHFSQPGESHFSQSARGLSTATDNNFRQSGSRRGRDSYDLEYEDHGSDDDRRRSSSHHHRHSSSRHGSSRREDYHRRP